MTKSWRELYDRLSSERRAEIELQVMHDLEGMQLIDRCTYESVAWRCVKKQGHPGGCSPFLEDGECELEVGGSDGQPKTQRGSNRNFPEQIRIVAE